MSTRRTVRAYPFDMEEISVSETYHVLQRDEPMSRVQMPFGEQAWLATRYADVKLVTKDPRFSRELAQGLDQPRMRRQQMGDGIMGMDPPDHSRLRRLVSKAFTPRTVERLKPYVERLAGELADGLVRRGGGDLLTDVAEPLPVAVIAEMLGIPEGDRAPLRPWSADICGMYELNPEPETARRAVRASVEFSAYLRELIAERRAEPGDDLISGLIAAHDEGDRLTEQG